jgi:hypothetical protein
MNGAANDGAMGGALDGGADGGADGGPVGPIPCGATFCRPDQSCVNGECEFSCPDGGVTVPGMFTNIGSAADSLKGVGGTVCVGDATLAGAELSLFNESIEVRGISPKRSIISGGFDIAGSWGRPSTASASLTVRGLDLDGGLTIAFQQGYTDHVAVIASKVVHKIYDEPAAVLISGSDPSDVLLDGDDLTCVDPNYTHCEAVELAGGIEMTIQNSYIHDAGGGVLAVDMSGGTLRIVNNTIVNNEYALEGGSGTFHLLVANNIIAHSLYAGTDGFPHSAIVHHHNVHWKNGGDWPLGMSDVTADPLLDGNTPPGLGSGSPARGTADPMVAPAVDYFGRARGKSPDIGAIQSP